jgi:signal transduction histidine kinase
MSTQPPMSKPINGIFYDVRIKTHYFGGQRQVLFVFTNISAEKDLQRELTMKEYAQIMFTSINHELRTPINAIQNSLVILKPFLNTRTLPFLEICESSCGFLLSLVNDTLDFAQLQTGKFKMNYESVNIRELQSEVCKLIDVQLRLKDSVFLIQSATPEVP